jgi:hypothetical protein
MLPLAQVLYLFAPLLVSAALPGIVLRFDLLATLRVPVDAGRTFRGRRIFGDGKTVRGFVVAIVGCTLTVVLQRLLAVPSVIRVVDYSSVNPVLFGGAMGLGAMLGELPNSFIKRQLGIEPGKTTTGALRLVFYVYDQIDLLASWLLISFWVRPTVWLVAASVVLALGMHPLVSLIGFVIGARKTAR